MAYFVKDGENGERRGLGQKVHVVRGDRHVYNLILGILPRPASRELDILTLISRRMKFDRGTTLTTSRDVHKT